MLIKIILTFFLQKNVPDWALAQCISIMLIKIIRQYNGMLCNKVVDTSFVCWSTKRQGSSNSPNFLYLLKV